MLIVCLFLEICWYDFDKKMAQPPRSVGRKSTQAFYLGLGYQFNV